MLFRWCHGVDYPVGKQEAARSIAVRPSMRVMYGTQQPAIKAGLGENICLCWTWLLGQHRRLYLPYDYTKRIIRLQTMHYIPLMYWNQEETYDTDTVHAALAVSVSCCSLSDSVSRCLPFPDFWSDSSSQLMMTSVLCTAVYVLDVLLI